MELGDRCVLLILRNGGSIIVSLCRSYVTNMDLEFLGSGRKEKTGDGQID